MTRQSAIIQSLTFVASGAVRAFRGIGYDGAEADTQGQKVLGVSQRAAAAAEASDVAVTGTTVVEAGAAITLGDSLIVDAQGRAIPSTGALGLDAGATAVTSSAANGDILTGGDLPEYVFADALEAASAAGDLIEVKLR
ncbi:capsid cement protein [Pyruvatibacter sp.]|uniref:capsid cement protein n=1 Tax=Pyruvatibacter sp. TaxID=1981328 RepID=UPI0032EA92CF